MPTRHDFDIVCGDTFTARICLKDAAGVAINLNGYFVRGQARTSYGSETVLLNLNPSIFTGVSGAALASGIVDVNITAAQAAQLPIGSFVYDIERYDSLNTTDKLIFGQMNVYPEVTR